MQYRLVSNTGSRRLILFFTGWGMDAAPFQNLRRSGYDIVVVWDYKSFDIDWSFTSAYDEVCVLAWSMGVFVSAVSTAEIEHRITRRMAVNGTLTPVNSLTGICDDIFTGTLNGLCDRTLMKFRRRMCGGSAAYDRFMACAPQRTVDDLRCELERFTPEATRSFDPVTRFDLALICRDDAIFTAENQRRAWQGTPIEEQDGSHLPDFQIILDKYFIDKERVEERFGSGLATYASSAHMQENAARRLAAAMTECHINAHAGRKASRTLEIGSGTGFLSRILDGFCGAEAALEMWDIAGDAPVEGRLRSFRRLDAETALCAQASASFDVIASASTVQWFNSPSRFLANCMRALVPGGYLAISSFERGNLAEVEAATGRGLPLLTMSQWLDLLPEGMAPVYSSFWSEKLDFDNAVDVFRHLKATGVNALGRTADGESALAVAVRRFPMAAHGKYTITYRPFILICKKL